MDYFAPAPEALDFVVLGCVFAVCMLVALGSRAATPVPVRAESQPQKLPKPTYYTPFSQN